MKNKKDIPRNYDLIVFCHLRWEFVFQRPQHIISRLATQRRVLFVEEPVAFEPQEENTGRLIEINPNLHVLQPKVASIEAIKNVIHQFVAKREVETGWFYSAAFESLTEEFSFGKIVYDCMDELSLFKGAPAVLIEQEKRLLAKADLVFTGGKSLYESKSRSHGQVYCFPSSVEQEHFAKSMNGISLPDDIAVIPQPIVGYYGVIDERIDLALLQEAAVLNPLVSFVMIGPLAKISEDELPRANNIYYLGMKPYAQLPNYLKAFRIAMMPFALNDSTRFISPTKTLEYMAANKPIISTPIYDVVRDYSHCVHITSGVNAFSEAIKKILSFEKPKALDERFASVLKATSWDTTVKQMDELLKN